MFALLRFSAAFAQTNTEAYLQDTWVNVTPTNHMDDMLGVVQWETLTFSTNRSVAWQWIRDGIRENHNGYYNLAVDTNAPVASRIRMNIVITPRTLAVRRPIVLRDFAVCFDNRFPYTWTVLKIGIVTGNGMIFLRERNAKEWKTSETTNATNQTAIFAADTGRFPFTSETNLMDRSGGLHILAVADKKTYGTNDRPVITVTFSNESSTNIVLLNHFAFTAVGPLFCPLLRNPENKKQYREASFALQISIRKTYPLWIILKPGESYRFQSALSDPLQKGHHFLQVRYSVSGPAESLISECRKEPSCPSDFWHGDLVSDVVNIEVTQ